MASILSGSSHITSSRKLFFYLFGKCVHHFFCNASICQPLQQSSLVFKQHSFSWSGTDTDAHLISKAYCRQVKCREICHCISHRLITDMNWRLLYYNVNQNIIVSFKFHKLLNGHDSSLIKFHITIQCKQKCQHIRKSKSAEQTSSDCCKITELNSYNMSKCFFHCAFCITRQSFMQFHLTKCDHAADPELLFGLFYLIQPQSGQVDCSLHISITHLYPEHASNDPVRALLVQLPGFFQIFYLFIILDLNHNLSSFSLIFQKF